MKKKKSIRISQFRLQPRRKSRNYDYLLAFLIGLIAILSFFGVQLLGKGDNGIIGNVISKGDTFSLSVFIENLGPKGSNVDIIEIKADGSEITKNCNLNSRECFYRFPIESKVMLKAKPAFGQIPAAFIGWGVTSNGVTTKSLVNPITISDRSYSEIKATFVSGHWLSVIVSPLNGGNVISEPSGISCGAGSLKCAAVFPDNSKIVLKEIPSSGLNNNYGFAGWRYDCEGKGDIAIIILDKDKKCFAKFIERV